MKIFGKTVKTETMTALGERMRAAPFTIENLADVIVKDGQFARPAAKRMAERILADRRREGKIDYASYGIGGMWQWKKGI